MTTATEDTTFTANEILEIFEDFLGSISDFVGNIHLTDTSEIQRKIEALTSQLDDMKTTPTKARKVAATDWDVAALLDTERDRALSKRCAPRAGGWPAFTRPGGERQVRDSDTGL